MSERTNEQEEAILRDLRERFGTDDYNQSDVNGIDLFAMADHIRSAERVLEIALRWETNRDLESSLANAVCEYAALTEGAR